LHFLTVYSFSLSSFSQAIATGYLNISIKQPKKQESTVATTIHNGYSGTNDDDDNNHDNDIVVWTMNLVTTL